MENSSQLRELSCSCFSRDVYIVQQRKNLSSLKPIYKCRACKRRFTPDDGFKKFRYPTIVIKTALDLLKKDISLGEIVHYLNYNFRTKLTRKTIFDWKKKFSKKSS